MKTIPIVIHVVYNTPEQNISEEQIKSQIEILNQDFSRTNPDKKNTPAQFLPVAANCGIQFCLVKVIRTQTNVTEFNDNDDVKSCSTGGSAALDTTKYMNVWVCPLGDRLLGYAEFPNTAVSPTYGVVVNYACFGSVGAIRKPYNLGRTLTHEISHCLGIYHIFSESNTNSCAKTDHCADIPSQSTPTSGCPTFPRTDDCSLSSPGVMFMNYMDYTNDACMNIFTKDQAKRMNAVLNIAPYKSLGSGDCKPLTEKYDCSGFAIPDTIVGAGFEIGKAVKGAATAGAAEARRNKPLALFILVSLVALFIIARTKFKFKTKFIAGVVYFIVAGLVYFGYSTGVQEYKSTEVNI